MEIELELKQGSTKYNFDKVIMCNLIDSTEVASIFPEDIRERVKGYLTEIAGGTGAYSASNGAPILRKDVAAGITERDGIACDPESLFLTDGASPGVHKLFMATIRTRQDGYLIPIPQYPLYSATMALYGGTLVPYYLDEAQGWGLDVEHVKDQMAKYEEQDVCIRGLVVINPGNPTGAVLSRANQEAVVALCAEKGLALVADEVYQENVYAAGKQFYSFRKVLLEGPHARTVPLISLHSCSKGFLGECGRRGGFFQLENVPADVSAELYKLASISLCSNVAGQMCSALMMRPPRAGEPSYELYAKERDDILASLKRRAAKMVEALRKLEGVSCNETEGALYVYPRIELPPGAVAAAAALGKQPDWLYCKSLLEEKGIVVVPGSGFKQVEGTFHFRTTLLPPESDIERVAAAIADFHDAFVARYKAADAQPATPPPKTPEPVAA